MSTLRDGRPAPDFSLPSTAGGAVTLSDFRGTADVMLVFYGYDWGGISTPELTGLGEVATAARERGAELIAISGDSPLCHAKFAGSRSVQFPLLDLLHALRASPSR